MEYHFSKIVPAEFTDAIAITKKALAAEGTILQSIAKEVTDKLEKVISQI